MCAGHSIKTGSGTSDLRKYKQVAVAHRNNLAGRYRAGDGLLPPIYTSLGEHEIAGTPGWHGTGIVKTRDTEICDIFLL
ncbi:hypothetical protein MESS2_300080 [Mesorhizobium metallidurans STM 2683]|uniref:Uncharacterized protein n=1 Tax=Mesorhizobium metallidurans STM 2683 TaxID=1297569 RepID=M5EPX6_9HYPH|nr:hypothetical protein MESS2_300080 [Mesorhizobium metallidurans STM 2683]